jgi:hypothetical protein
MIDKKEAKRKYKETLPEMGIYQIKNLANGKVFIGRSTNLKGKRNSILFQTTLGSHVSSELQADYNKSGGKDFVFEVLDILDPKEGTDYDYTKDLETLEELWIEKIQPYGDKGYNTLPRKL